MRKLKSLQLNIIRLSFFALFAGFVQATTYHSPEPELFVGTSPCALVMRPLLSVPTNMDCEMITWNLALTSIPGHESASRFRLKYTYGMSKPGTQGFMNDGISGELTGTWSEVKNTGKIPGKSLVSLHTTGQNPPINFAKLDARILHLLDPQGNLMIGNAAWSYTLGKVKND